MNARRLDEPAQLFEVMFEIYNLASVVRDDESLNGSARARITKLKNETMVNFKDTFTGTIKPRNDVNDDHPSPSKRSRIYQSGHIGGVTRHDERIYDNYEVAKAFAEARYSLEPNGEDENGLAPLNQVKATIYFSVCSLELMR
jgi:hypothetical protein